MEHIIEIKEDVVKQLMGSKPNSFNQRAPFKKFTLVFPNSIFSTREQIILDVIDSMAKNKGLANVELDDNKKSRLDKLANKYINGTCNLKVKCNDSSESLQFKASLYDPMGSLLIRFIFTDFPPIPLVEENNFSKTPLVTASALTNLILGIIEYLNSPREVISKREVREPKTSKKSNKSKKGKNKKTYIHKCYYSIDKVESTNKRKYERHAESWATRGHWRKYSNGKVVWIKEHVRGKGKVSSKSYKINKLDK